MNACLQNFHIIVLISTAVSQCRAKLDKNKKYLCPSTGELKADLDAATNRLEAEIVGVKDELKSEIAGVKDELKACVGRVKGELTRAGLGFPTDTQHGQAISVGSGYATMKCLNGERQTKGQGIGDIADGFRVDTHGCSPLKTAEEAKNISSY